MPGVQGPAGPTGPTGPQGPAGFAIYYAGWINATGTIRMGSGFTSSRLGLTGSYRVTANPTSTGFFMVPIVSLGQAGVTARVVQYSKDGTTGQHIFDVEIRDGAGTLVDSDFTFILVQRQ
jgi:hypothetical protein